MDKATLLKNAKRKVVDVEVPELGCKLKLTSLSASKALELAEMNEEKAKGFGGIERKMMLLLVQNAIIDDGGKPVFGTDAQAAAQFLDGVSMETINILMKEAPGFMPKEAPAAAVPDPSKAG